jgi:hypothetical protein
MKRALLLVFASAGLGCAPVPHPAAAPPSAPQAERALAIPPDLAPHIQESIDLGRMLFALDKASAIGTHVLREKVPDFKDRGVGGWLTLRDGDDTGKLLDSFSVMFFTKEEPFRNLFRIAVPIEGEPTFEALSPPTPLNELGIRLVRAGQTALRAVPRGARPWNPVIMQGAAIGRRDGILVYCSPPRCGPARWCSGSTIVSSSPRTAPPSSTRCRSRSLRS